jgi:hypothetical protein
LPFLPAEPEPVSFEEVARVLAEAITRTGGGLAGVIPASGRHLASALDAAGFQVMRKAETNAQLTL